MEWERNTIIFVIADSGDADVDGSIHHHDVLRSFAETVQVSFSESPGSGTFEKSSPPHSIPELVLRVRFASECPIAVFSPEVVDAVVLVFWVSFAKRFAKCCFTRIRRSEYVYEFRFFGYYLPLFGAIGSIGATQCFLIRLVLCLRIFTEFPGRVHSLPLSTRHSNSPSTKPSFASISCRISSIGGLGCISSSRV